MKPLLFLIKAVWQACYISFMFFFYITSFGIRGAFYIVSWLFTKISKIENNLSHDNVKIIREELMPYQRPDDIQSDIQDLKNEIANLKKAYNQKVNKGVGFNNSNDLIIDVNLGFGGEIPKQEVCEMGKIDNINFINLPKDFLNTLSDDEVWLINNLDIPYKRSILNNKDAEILIIREYLNICKKVNSVLKAKSYSLQKRMNDYFQSPYHYGNTLYTLYCIAEFSVSDIIFKNEAFDSSNFSLSLLSEQIGPESEKSVKDYLIGLENNLYGNDNVKIIRNELKPGQWRGDIESIFSNNKYKDGNLLKAKCDELLFLNQNNPYIHLIYLDLHKKLSKTHKISSLVYYYKYQLLLKKYNKKDEIKQIGVKNKKEIFIKDDLKYQEFMDICNSETLIEDDSIRQKINGIFELKRKKININHDKIIKVDKDHSNMNEKLNIILQDNDIDSYIDKEITSVSEVFDITDNVDFNKIEINLLAIFKKYNYIISDVKLSEFAKENSIIKNSLIKKINQKFYSTYEDILLEQEDENYFITKENQKIINENYVKY